MQITRSSIDTQPMRVRGARGRRVRASEPERSRRVVRLLLALFVVVSLAACGGTDDDGEQGASAPETTTSGPSPGPSSASGDQDTGVPDGTPIRMSFGATEITARLQDNAAARALAAQLPLTLSFRDHNNAEKTAPLPRELPLAGAPAGHDPAAGDIGYWAPDADLVLYYDEDAPYFDGIVRVGRFDGDKEAIALLPEGADVTIERAE
jgi:hypothetical protein